MALCGAPLEGELLVSAAASLADALPEVGRAWEAAGGEKVTFNFAASSALVSQIAAGAPVDLIFTADQATMDRLAAGGLLLDGTRRDLLANRLAVVVPRDCSMNLARAEDLARPEIGRLALADPSAVPAGRYALRWLEARGVWAALESRVVPTLNVRAALSTVAAGEADAGVVYATDVTANPGVELAFLVPDGEGPRIEYPAAVVSGARRSAAARRLLEYFSSPAAQTIFARFGFRAPSP